MGLRPVQIWTDQIIHGDRYVTAADNDDVLHIGKSAATGAKRLDVKEYGSASTKFRHLDASLDTLFFEGVSAKLNDSDALVFGDGASATAAAGDVTMRWDGTDFDILATADDSVLKIGNGTASFDFWLYGNSASDYLLSDASANLAQLKGGYAFASIMPDTTFTDPGDAGAIPVTKTGFVELVSAGAETRTLAAPTYAGQLLLLTFKTDGGDCVVTCATTVNQTGNNTITFNDAGDAVLLIGKVNGSDKRWSVVVNDGAALSTV